MSDDMKKLDNQELESTAGGNDGLCPADAEWNRQHGQGSSSQGYYKLGKEVAIQVTASSLNCRTAPSTSAGILKSYNNGHVLYAGYMSNDGAWYGFWTNEGPLGWVSAGYVKVIG